MAAKRHHHHPSPKTRHEERHEHHSPHARDRAMHMEGEYAGHEHRRHQEMRDAGMIHEDHMAIANLPQGVMIKPYGKAGSYMPEDIDDTIRGIDHQMMEDDMQRDRHYFPKKV